MARYKNDKVLKAFGKRIKALRIQAELEIEDLAGMTGFTYNTISNIENGSETYFSYFIEICFALGSHPKEILDIELEIKPRNTLSPNRLEKSRLTKRIKTYVQKGYFKEAKSAQEVTEKLKTDYKLGFLSKNVSVILSRLAKDGVLKVKKEGRKNFYSIKDNKQ